MKQTPSRYRWALALFLANALTSFLVAQSQPRTIHVFVALADNKNQGIVPVATMLGNGDDPQHNLYWGSAYGVKTYFARSADWLLVASSAKPRPEILERSSRQLLPTMRPPHSATTQ